MRSTYEVRSFSVTEAKSRWRTFKLALESANRYRRGHPINNGWHTPADADSLYITDSESDRIYLVREAKWIHPERDSDGALRISSDQRGE